MMPIAVTGLAIQRRAFELQRPMAFLAGYDGVASDQGETTDIVIEGCHSTPVGLAVTLFAAVSKLAFVLVVLLVTGHTGRCQLVAIEVTGVAEVALGLYMRGPQWIFGLVVIEMYRLPFVLVVAGFALDAVPSGMNVLNSVAVHALGADTLVAFAGMTARAGDSLMSAQQRKPGGVVVERLDLTPFGFAVATITLFTKAPLMRINRLVTIEAPPERLAKFYLRCVTAGARHCFVRFPKLEIGEGVVERFAIKLDDVGISSLVIGMAMVAFSFCAIRVKSVKSLARRTIDSDVLVTVETAPRLRPARERFMTFATVLLELGMSVDDRPRHDKLFEQILRMHRRCKSACHNHSDQPRQQQTTAH